MQTLKRKWQNFKTCRHLHDMWSDYISKSSSEPSSSLGRFSNFQSLSEFVESLKTALDSLELSSGRRQIDSVFSESADLLRVLLFFLKTFLEIPDFFTSSPSNSENLNNVILGLEILAKSEKFTKIIENAPEVNSAVNLIIDKPDAKNSVIPVLRLVQNFSFEGKKELCRLGVVHKIMGHLLDGDENIIKEVLNTIKAFLLAPVMETQNEEGFRKKLSRVIGGVTKLAWSFFPSEDSSRSNEKLSEETDDQPIFPPPESSLRTANSAFQSRFHSLEEAEKALSANSTPVKEENKQEAILQEFLQLRGASTIAAKALTQVPDWAKCEILMILSILLTSNIPNQKEFRKADGYTLIYESLNTIEVSSKEGLRTLEHCFKVLIAIALNEKNSTQVGNIHAFNLILHLGATSQNAWVVKGAVECLQNLMFINWENVVCLYEQANIGNLMLTLERNVVETERPINVCKENVEILPLLDETLRYISFLLGNAWEKNMEVVKIYANVLQKHSEVLGDDHLRRLILSMQGIVADINVRCNRRNAFVRSTFLGCFEGMKQAAISSLVILERDIELVLPLIAHLLQYELLYTETLLSSPFSQDVQNTLFPMSLIDTFENFFNKGILGKWVFEKFLVTKCSCEGIENELLKLVGNGELLLVVKILMMDDYQNIDKFRAGKCRDRFLDVKGLEIIRQGVPAVEYLWLMMGATKNSPELKYRISTAVDLRVITEEMSPSAENFHVLFELATCGGYMETSDYFAKVASSLPSFTSDTISQVTNPHYLFNPVSHSRHSSNTNSMIQQLDRSQLLDLSLKSCTLVSGSYVLAILSLLPRSPQEIQLEVLKRLLSFSKRYINKQLLCNIQTSKLIYNLIPKLHNSVHEICYALMTSLLTYSISQDEATMLLDSLKTLHIQQILSTCLSLDLHQNFYLLHNETLETPILTSFPRSGYSLMFWVKIDTSSSDLTQIFSWVDHNRGLVLFKLSMMQAGDKKISSVDFMKSSMVSEPGNYFLIQAPTQPVLPSPDNVAKFSVEKLSGWVHIAIIHSKAGILLYINNSPLSLFKCTNFASIKEKFNVTGVFGSKTAKVLVSSVFYVDGALEAAQVQACYEKETPEKAIFKLPDEIPSLQPGSFSLTEGSWDVKNLSLPHNIHITCPIKQALGRASAIPLFLSLLKTDLQPLAFSYICDCITENSANYKFFIENGGWSLLGGILAKHEEFSTSESLEFMVSAVFNKANFHQRLKKMLVVKAENIPFMPSERLEGFCVISELLTVLPAKSLTGILDCFTKIIALEDNAKLFLSPDVNGLMVILELINSLVNESYQNIEYLVLTLYEKLLPFFNQDQLEVFLDFLASPDLRMHFSRIERTIENILSIFSVHLYSGNSTILEKFLVTEGNLLLFEIARSPSLAIKCAAIRIIGLLLSISPKYKAWFLKAKGFDMLNNILQKQKPNKKIYEILILLSQNSFNNVSLLYPEDAGSVKMIINLSTIAAKALPTVDQKQSEKKIVFVEAFEVLFDILKLETDELVKCDVFNIIENMLDIENCEKLLDCGFLVWASGLVKETQPLMIQAKESKNYQIFDTFIIKLCLYDLNLPSNKCKLLHWISKIPDADSFKEKCLLSLLNKIKTNPDFEAQDGYVTNKANFIKNLYMFIQNCDLVISYSEINMKIMHLINLLASCNTPAVRQQMKAIGYFDLRDDLIIQMLKEDLPQNLLIEGIQCFSFETIASQPKFRDSNAVIYFVKFLIEFQNSPSLQMEILNLIRNDICVHEENRKYLRRILENKFFLDFLAGFKNDEGNSIAQCFRSMKNLKLDEENEDIPENPTAEDFLNWLNKSDKAKKIITMQVNKHLSSVDSEYKKNYNKAIEIKAAKRKKTIDAMIKDKTNVQKQVNELELKLITRVTKAEERSTQRFQLHSSFKSQKLSIGARKSL